MNGGWRPTRAFGRAAAVGLALLVIGTGLRRGDVAVLGVPLLGVALWSVLTAPRVTPTAHSRLEGGPVHEGESLTWRAAMPHATAARWGRQTGVLATLGGVCAGLGLLASCTPVGWGPWVGAVALMAIAGTTVLLRAAAGRRA